MTLGKLFLVGVKAVANAVTPKGVLQMGDNGSVTLDGQECRPESSTSVRTQYGSVVEFDEPVIAELNNALHPAVLYNQLPDGLSFDPERQEARFVSKTSAVTFAQTTGWTTWNHDGSYCSISE